LLVCHTLYVDFLILLTQNTVPKSFGPIKVMNSKEFITFVLAVNKAKL